MSRCNCGLSHQLWRGCGWALVRHSCHPSGLRARGRGLQALRGLFKGQEDNVLSFLLEVAGQEWRREQ